MLQRNLMRDFLQELRYALRGFLKNPVLAAAALLSLALGIGANTAIFSLMDQILLRSLPVKDAAKLVLFSAPGPRSGFMDTNYGDEVSFSYPMYCDFRDRAPALAGVLARYPARLSMSWAQQTELVDGDLVSGNYFDVLGVGTVIGRPLTSEDDRVGTPNEVAVLSYQFWKNRFGASPSVLNQTLRLNGRPFTVVGVAQPGFPGVGVGEAPAVFVPITTQPRLMKGFDGSADRRAYWLNIFGRLAAGTPRAQAESLLNQFWRPVLEQEAKDHIAASAKFRERFTARHLSLLAGGRGISSVRDQASGPLIVLMCMVGVLLLITCANVANLLIARAAGRRKEISIRLALGAGRRRLVRLLLAEGLCLSIVGGCLGILVAVWTGDFLLSYLPVDAGTIGLNSRLDFRVLGFGLILSLVTGVIFGLAPALDTFRIDIAGNLKQQAASVMGSGRTQVAFRKALVAAQVGLSLMLLIGAGLFARSLFNLKHVNPGFRSDHLLSFSVQPSLNGYTQQRIRDLYERLSHNLATLPQVQAVTMNEVALLSGNINMSGLEIPGYQPKEGESMSIRNNWVGPGYFAAIGIPLISGREFTQQDNANATRVAVLNEQMAKQYFGGQNAIGRRFRFSSDKKAGPGDIEVVGVVRDGKHSDLREPNQTFAYFPYMQHASLARMTFYVRTAQDPSAIGSALRSQVRQADPNLPVFDMKTVDQQIGESMFAERLIALLSTLFGILATLLAAIGLYGVMAYTVSRRTRELGLRMALGAAREEILRMIMREVGWLALTGIAVAIPVAYGLSRYVQSQLFNVKGDDPLVFIVATVGLALVAAIAGLIPATRATRIDPLTALRHE